MNRPPTSTAEIAHLEHEPWSRRAACTPDSFAERRVPPCGGAGAHLPSGGRLRGDGTSWRHNPRAVRPIGMAGWLFQATWVPQHLMAASCVVAAMLLVTRCVLQQTLALVLTIALLVIAGFESSAFVGGITFAFAGLIAAPMLFAETDQKKRLRFVGGIAIAALLVVCLTAPFVRDQLAMVACPRRR